MDITSDEMLTPAQTAAITGLTEDELLDRRRRRIEPAYVKLGEGKRGLVRYRASVLLEWLTRNAEQDAPLGTSGEKAMELSGIEDRLMTPEEVANLTGFTVRALAGRRARGEGPPYVKMGPGPKARTRYRQSVVEAWLRDCEAASPTVKMARPLGVPQAVWALTNLEAKAS